MKFRQCADPKSHLTRYTRAIFTVTENNFIILDSECMRCFLSENTLTVGNNAPNFSLNTLIDPAFPPDGNT